MLRWYVGTTSSRPLHSAVRRLPWLFFALLSGVLSAAIITHYHDILQRWALLVAFIPTLLGLGGDAGVQSLAVTIRGLTSRRLNRRTVWKTAGNEILTALVLSLLSAGAVFIFAHAWRGDVATALVVGGAAAATLFSASLMGVLVPVALHLLRVDPAIASAPIIGLAVDLMGLIIYFTLAGMMLARMGA
jgi:magnesium transporter